VLQFAAAATSETLFSRVSETEGHSTAWIIAAETGTSIAVCQHPALAGVTFIYCYPTVLETEAGRAAVDDTLASLAAELKLDDKVRLRKRRGNSIIVRGVEPEALWRAMDRAVPDWEDRRLFFAPVFI
jgi:hypothetical protein